MKRFTAGGERSFEFRVDLINALNRSGVGRSEHKHLGPELRPNVRRRPGRAAAATVAAGDVLNPGLCSGLTL